MVLKEYPFLTTGWQHCRYPFSVGSMRTHPGFNPERSGGATSTASGAGSAASAGKGGVFMRRDPGRERRLDVKRNEKADRYPGGQDRGQGHLHRGFAVLPANFLAPVLDLDPHPILLELLSEITTYCPPATDRASRQGAHEITLAAQAYTNLNLQFLMYRPWCRAARGVASTGS